MKTKKMIMAFVAIALSMTMLTAQAPVNKAVSNETKKECCDKKMAECKKSEKDCVAQKTAECKSQADTKACCEKKANDCKAEAKKSDCCTKDAKAAN
jgi:hypothetical protein